MEVTREEMIQSMQELSSGELLRHLRSGVLTAQGREVASEVLRGRGVDSDTAPTPPGGGEPQEQELVTVAEYLSQTEASLLQGMLESRGIAAHIWGEYVGAAQVVLPTAGGGAHLQVHPDQLKQAQAVLAAYERGEMALPEAPGI